MADCDHCSQPNNHNNQYSKYHTIDHLQITQAGLGNHKN